MRRAGSRLPPLDRDAAEAIGLQGLTFLAEEPSRLARFLALTGLEAGEVRARAGAPELLLAVLEHLNTDESLLLTFTAGRNLAPESIARAIALLGGAPP
jgi:hypothetical protein